MKQEEELKQPWERRDERPAAGHENQGRASQSLGPAGMRSAGPGGIAAPLWEDLDGGIPGQSLEKVHFCPNVSNVAHPYVSDKLST